DARTSAARDQQARALQAALDQREASDQPGRRESPVVSKLLCAGCHVDQDNAADDGRLPLDGASRKFQRGALATYLRDPAAHYPWNPMPSFRLGADEAVQVEAALRGGGGGRRRDLAPPPTDPQVIARGRTLVETTGCLHCHDAPGAGLQ